MLKKDAKTGEWKIAGIGVVRPIDANERAAKRSAKATENPLQGIFSQGFKMPAVEQRAAAIISRDNMAQRERMQPFYNVISEKLLTGNTAGNLVAALTAAREMKPEVAAAKLRETLPADLLAVKNGLSDAVVSHVARRLKPAQEAVRLALQPDPLADPGQAASQAVRAMEIRARLGSMSAGDRAKQAMQWGRAGNVEALAACREDPFGCAVPAETMAAADRECLTALGGRWLADDLADAEEEAATLATLADVTYATLQNELRNAGVPAGLLQDSLAATQWLNSQLAA